MVERASALGIAGAAGVSGPGVHLSERPLQSVWLIAAWPDTLEAAGRVAAAAAGTDAAPGLGTAVRGRKGDLLRTEPLKWLLVGETDVPRPELAEADGSVLELGHARTAIHVSGPRAVEMMACMVPIDLRPGKFPEGTVAGTAMHHVAVAIVATDGGFDVLVARSLARVVWDALVEVSAQFQL